ncbi:NERD domain-containing protein [Virgibacillus profundi]|nr:NERD domain-containing protein [Virgibacillus profundi]
MAQLIKLRDYISRYEWNAYRYPSQFIRLKQDNWRKLQHTWNNPSEEIKEENLEAPETGSKFSKWKNFLKKDIKKEEVIKQKPKLPDTKTELKHYFLDEMLRFQLKWATSTVTDKSFMDESYHKDPLLKYFLQRFPDIYLIMFYPVFNVRKAPIDGEIILISPVGIEIIYVLEEPPQAEIVAGDERTWTIEDSGKESKIINPIISLKRTEQIIRSILNSAVLDFSIQKTVLSRTNNIVFSAEPYNLSIVGNTAYEEWFQEKRRLQSPLKSRQLKAAEALLKHCQSTSVKRPEWEEDTNAYSFMDEK